jgi:hypothetical protein
MPLPNSSDSFSFFTPFFMNYPFDHSVIKLTRTHLVFRPIYLNMIKISYTNDATINYNMKQRVLGVVINYTAKHIMKF